VAAFSDEDLFVLKLSNINFVLSTWLAIFFGFSRKSETHSNIFFGLQFDW